MTRVLCILIFLIPLTIGCRTEKSEKILARVGDAELTEGELRKQFSDPGSLTDAELRMFVQSWINEELLFQEGTRRGVDKTDQFSEQIDLVRRQIVSQLYLEKEVYSDTSGVADSAAAAYFDRHREEFPVREDALKLQIAHFLTRASASSFAAYFAHGLSWDSASTLFGADSARNKDLTGNIPPGYYTERTLIPEELWKVASTLNPGEASFPLNLTTGYAVILLVEKIRRGDAPVFEVVQGQVKERLMMERRRLKYSQTLESLRKKYKIETFVNNSN